jgi:hypothetical protein
MHYFKHIHRFIFYRYFEKDLSFSRPCYGLNLFSISLCKVYENNSLSLDLFENVCIFPSFLQVVCIAPQFEVVSYILSAI